MTRDIAQNPTFIFAEVDRLAYFQMLYEGFQRAQQATGSAIEHFYNIGGYSVCLRFAGSALISQVIPALAHLEIEATVSPSLTVCLWDSISSATKMPLMVASLIRLWSWYWWGHLDPRREIIGYNSDRIRTAFQPGPDILSALDREQNLALYWIEDASSVPYFERGSPLQTILHWWASSQQRQFVHAAAVGMPQGGVLIAGQGGQGKSSTALACLASTLHFASDDYCLVTSEPEPYVYSLYNTAKLRGAEDMQRFPQLAPLISNHERINEEKLMLFLHTHYPQRVIRGFPLKAVLLPHVSHQVETSLHRVSPAQALRALAPSTLFQLSGAGQDALHAMAKLVRSIPCYRMEVGTDMSQIPAAISALLESLS